MALRAREVVILVALCALASLPGACGSVKPPDQQEDPCGGACGPDQVCRDGTCTDPCEGVECEDDLVCIGGECAPVLVDEDGDGFEASTDCDDTDENIFPGSTRACSGECGNGIEVCREGTWQDCSVPKNCKCEKPLEEACERCGTAIRDCIDGLYAVDPGPCQNMGECERDAVEILECGCEGVADPCDACGSQSHTCGSDCTWGPPTECFGTEVEEDTLCASEIPFCNSNGICVSAA